LVTSIDVTFFEITPFFSSISSDFSSTLSIPYFDVLLAPNSIGSLASALAPPLQTYHYRPQPHHEDTPTLDVLVDSSPPLSLYFCFLTLLCLFLRPLVRLFSSRKATAMLDEITTFDSFSIWDLVPLTLGKSTIGCHWVYIVKVGLDGWVDRFKARLVAKGYTQIFSLDYGDTFSHVAKISSIQLFLSIAVIRHWPLHQLDIKNAFLHIDLQEKVSMEQPPRFVAQGESRLVC